MRGLRRGISLIAIMVLMMGQILPAAALPQGGNPGSGGEGNARPDVSIGVWEELKVWLRSAGGTATLTANIVLPAEESFNVLAIFPGVGAVLDCGAYTIYVEGELFFEAAAGLTVRGEGGEEGLFHIRDGGNLVLSFLTLTASQGAALVQEEGSLVTLARGEPKDGGVTVDGEIRFATRPVLVAPHIKDYMDAPYILIPEKTDYTPFLPPTRQADLYFEGGRVTLGTREDPDGPYGFQQPVTWDISDKQAEALAERQRTLLGGRFTGALTAPGFSDMGEGYRTLFHPEVLMIFPVDGAALLECGFASKTGALRLAFTFSPEPEVYRLLRSDDQGESWGAVGEDHVPKSGKQFWELTHWLDTPEDMAAWYLVEAQYVDPEGPEGVRLVHTDTITVAGADILPVRWIDGHRGGGEDITGGEPPPPTITRPPDLPPPEWDSEDVEDSEDTTGGEPPPPTETRPPDPPPSVVPSPLPEVTLLPQPPPATLTSPEPLPVPTPEALPNPVEEEPVPAAAEPEKPPPAPLLLTQGNVQKTTGDSSVRSQKPQESSAEVVAQEPLALPEETPEPLPIAPENQPVVAKAVPEQKPVVPEEEPTSALTPAAQIAIGCGVLATLGSGAVIALNPSVVKELLFHRKNGR